MNTYTLQQAIELATNEAERKIKQGKFIRPKDDGSDIDEMEDLEGGDPENVHTLVSLYGQFLSDEDASELENYMFEKYPEYC